ncbi:MAG: hypothetical protein Q4D33_13120 [Prevotellaceae bacterium]|nr:hypothetical protein [Prevotellaceae bacterium]
MNGLENMTENLEQTKGHSEGTEMSRLSDVANDYLNEAIETRDPEMIVNRIDELCDRIPPKAIDANPEIGEKIEDFKEGIDNKYLEAPSDLEQVKQISECMSEIEGTRYEEWQCMSPQERLEAMQKVENAAAEVAHRPACEVKGESLGEGYFGYFDPNSKSITLNTDYLDGSYECYKDTLDTIIHEGRHAYQHYNVDERQVHPSDGDCTNWSKNLHENMWGMFPENIGYQSPQEVGFERYWMQPVEADARAFAEDVFNKFNQMA